MSKNNLPSNLDAKLIIDDPYLFEQCQVDIHLALFPQEGATPRQAALSITSHGDAPTFKVYQTPPALPRALSAGGHAVAGRWQSA
jgi:hypothetical protein